MIKKFIYTGLAMSLVFSGTVPVALAADTSNLAPPDNITGGENFENSEEQVITEEKVVSNVPIPVEEAEPVIIEEEELVAVDSDLEGDISFEEDDGSTGVMMMRANPSWYNQMRNILNAVGGSHVPLKIFNGQCGGVFAMACSRMATKDILVHQSISSWSTSNKYWAMTHELAHQYQFNVWGPLHQSKTYKSLYGGNIELLANCMAQQRGYPSPSTRCSTTQLNWAANIWKNKVPDVAAPKPTPKPPAVTVTPSKVSWLPKKQIGNGWPSTVIFPGDFNRNGYADMILKNSKGDLMLYRGKANERFYAPIKIGNGWNGFDWIQGGVDWDGDGNTDLMTRTRGTGEMRLYPGNGAGRFKSAKKLSSSSDTSSRLTMMNTAKGPAIYEIGENTLYYRAKTSSGNIGARQVVGQGWSTMTALMPTGDWTGDRIPDLLARKSDGKLFLYAGKADGRPGRSVQVGNGWNGMSAMSVSNPNKAKQGVWSVDKNGKLWSYKRR